MTALFRATYPRLFAQSIRLRDQNLVADAIFVWSALNEQLDCKAESMTFTGLLHYVFDHKPGDISAAFSETWETKLCTIAEHFVVVSTERFDESLTFLSKLISTTSVTEPTQDSSGNPTFKIVRRPQKANVMASDSQHTDDRDISFGALAMGDMCLRDARASYHFMSNLEDDQSSWFQ